MLRANGVVHGMVIVVGVADEHRVPGQRPVTADDRGMRVVAAAIRRSGRRSARPICTLLVRRYHCGRSQIAETLPCAQWNDDVKWSSTVTAQLTIGLLGDPGHGRTCRDAFSLQSVRVAIRRAHASPFARRPDVRVVVVVVVVRHIDRAGGLVIRDLVTFGVGGRSWGPPAPPRKLAGALASAAMTPSQSGASAVVWNEFIVDVA